MMNAELKTNAFSFRVHHSAFIVFMLLSAPFLFATMIQVTEIL
jgi:hypothetical protein